mgnify:CR=1 FL=1
MEVLESGDNQAQTLLWKEDLLNTHNDLALNGVYTDFLYEKDGERGLWLEVKSIKE